MTAKRILVPGLALAICLVHPTTSVAQNGLNALDMADIVSGRTVSTQNLNQRSSDRAAAIAGTPVLGYYGQKQSWHAGTIQQLDGQTSPVSGLRYNLKLQWLEAQDAAAPDGIKVYTGGTLKGFTLIPAAGQVPLQFREVKYRSLRSGSGRGMLQVLNTTGAIHLLARHVYVEHGPQMNLALNTEMRPAYQTQTTTLYAIQPEKPDVAVELTPDRSIMRLFKKHASEMEQQIKAMGWRYDKLEDVVKMVELYNTIASDDPIE
ncbi:hypothetical protein [Hymenobacter sediminicola]|uniref:DUF4468 domain-containing protein n=1 Tax=Hymenobacter sediminicola TaxID=2761579 RepID=A0A7G7W810_9BACT|nr:hypothetical protein [Hymenobacter sediminicola]QNH62503.1 hypothetical protein H4317_01355 [Hymenobacter sediminicola]